jgi:hypothetical protein
MAANNGSSYIDVSYGSLSVRKDGLVATTWATFGPSGLTVFGAITGTSIIASGLISAQNGLTVSSGNLTVSSGTLTVSSGTLTANNGLVVSGAVITANAGLTVNNAAITAQNGLTVNNAVITANAGLTVNNAALTVGGVTTISNTGLITASAGLTVSGGNLTAAAITATTIYASSAMTASAGLSVSGGTLTAAAITATTIYASSAMTASAGLSVSGGTLTINSITATLANRPVLYLDENKQVVGSNTEFYYTTGGALTVGSVNTTSDYRIKQNVQPITDNIDELKPVSYYNTLTKRQDLGFIAHEVQQHFPMLVSGEKDGVVNQSINYSGLIPVLVAEIQELKTEVKVLKRQMQQVQQMYSLV